MTEDTDSKRVDQGVRDEQAQVDRHRLAGSGLVRSIDRRRRRDEAGKSKADRARDGHLSERITF